MSYHTIHFIVCDGDLCKQKAGVANEQNVLAHRSHGELTMLINAFGWMKTEDDKHLCSRCAMNKRFKPSEKQLSGELPYGRRKSDIELNSKK